VTWSEPLDLPPMHRALELAARGQGCVEPNPMVGCVLVRDGRIVGEGYHEQYGHGHAEVNALAMAGAKAEGATAYVTLEPCSHHGKTPPCAEALIRAKVKRVVAAMLDPFPEVSGQGFAMLRRAGIEVASGLFEAEARRLNGPYLKLIERRRPWVIGKWAMTLCGHIATRTGHSQWISSEASRAEAHRLRGRVDGVLVGSGTARADDPRLTARPPGPRTANRIVFDSQATLSPESHLAQTARTQPVIVVASDTAPPDRVAKLEALGCEVLRLNGATHAERIGQMLDEFGRRRMTNLLVEGGGGLLGALLEAGEIDEVHAFIAPRIIGGSGARSPIGGLGLATIDEGSRLDSPTIEQLGEDIYLHGPVARSKP
jgi:diaminohydroxyphosphoribosylaminopyrimidine deaminase/5-amino-6-(5-phosphoribosylamino)uracil reductase